MNAIITGATGQDSPILAQLLLDKGYKVYALSRRSARELPDYVDMLIQNKNYTIVDGDITDFSTINRLVKEIKPNEFYHLAAQSEVGTSFKQPINTLEITGLATINCLEAIRGESPHTRFYFAGSSEQFGGSDKALDENSLMYPKSPYACGKLLGYNITRVYRESYGMFASCGILFNHESVLRRPYFVTRKISIAAAKIALDLITYFNLGNMGAKRDWMSAKDAVNAMWLILQHKEPDDFVVASGESYSIKEFLEIAFKIVSRLSGRVLHWDRFVGVDKGLMRPNEVNMLLGNPTKIKQTLGWVPKYSFYQLVEEMVTYDYDRLKEGLITN